MTNKSEERNITVQDVMNECGYKSKTSVDRLILKLEIKKVYVDFSYWARHRIMFTKSEADRMIEYRETHSRVRMVR